MITIETNSLSNQMQAIIRDLDVFDDNVNAEITEAMNAGANIIQAEQKRRAPTSSIADDIDRSPVRASGKGRVYISTGYWPRNNPHAIAGIIKEFGRGGGEQKQKDSLGRKIGYIPAEPHLREGFDAAEESAFAETLSALDRAVEKYGKSKGDT